MSEFCEEHEGQDEFTEGFCPWCRLAELEKENAELRNECAKGVHTCHANCPRPMCVLTRENEALKAAINRAGAFMSQGATNAAIVTLKEALRDD